MILLFVVLIIVIIITCSRLFKDNFQEEQFTIVICNYSRPHNIDKSLPILQKNFPNSEIIITHGNPLTYKDYDGCINIKQYDINKLYGGTQRFFSAINASHDKILFLDDDVIPSIALVKKLLEYQINNNISICGPIRRRCNHTGYKFTINKYNSILTPILMTNKLLIENYLKNFNRYEKHLKTYKGNGEDLSFNHNLYFNFYKKPVYINGKYKYLDKSNGYSSKKNHYKVRNDFCKEFYS